MSLVKDYRGVKPENIKLNDLVPMAKALPRNQYVDAHTYRPLLLPTKIVWLLEENLELLRNWLELIAPPELTLDKQMVEKLVKMRMGEELADILHFVASIADILEIDLAKVFLSKYKRNMRRKPRLFTEKKVKKSKEKYADVGELVYGGK